MPDPRNPKTHDLWTPGGDSKRRFPRRRGKERKHFRRALPSPPPHPDDSFSNGFLTHRIPSRDNVHDSSRASCVHKGKVAGIDRLFPRPLPPSCKYNFNLGGNLERRGEGAGVNAPERSGNRNSHFQRPIFQRRIPSKFQAQFQGFSRIENSIFKLFPILRDGCSVMFVAVKISRQVRFSSRLFRIYAVSGFRIQN